MKGVVYLLRPNNIEPKILEAVTNRLNGLGLRIEATPSDGVWEREQVLEIMRGESLLVCAGNNSLTKPKTQFIVGRGVWSTLHNFMKHFAFIVEDQSLREFYTNEQNKEVIELLALKQKGSTFHFSDIKYFDDSDCLVDDHTSEYCIEWEDEDLIEFCSSAALPIPIFAYHPDTDAILELSTIQVDNCQFWNTGAIFTSYIPPSKADPLNKVFLKLAEIVVARNNIKSYNPSGGRTFELEPKRHKLLL